MAFGANLAKALRDYRGPRSQEWLAKELKVSTITIQRWEKHGAGSTSLNELERIASIVGVPAAALIGLPTDPPPASWDTNRALYRGLAKLEEAQIPTLLEVLSSLADVDGDSAGLQPSRRHQGK